MTIQGTGYEPPVAIMASRRNATPPLTICDSSTPNMKHAVSESNQPTQDFVQAFGLESNSDTPAHVTNAPIPYLPPIVAKELQNTTSSDAAAISNHGLGISNSALRAMDMIAYNNSQNGTIFTIFGQDHPGASARYNDGQVQLLETLSDHDKSVFLLFELYGRSQYATNILQGHNISLRYAQERYRELCKLMWRWHEADKRAMVQVMKDLEASRFALAARIMERDYQTNAWPRQLICNEWTKYETFRQTYFDED